VTYPKHLGERLNDLQAHLADLRVRLDIARAGLAEQERIRDANAAKVPAEPESTDRPV
jgi:hypothetical protein